MSRPTKPKLEQRLSMLRDDPITPEARVFGEKCRDWLSLETNQDKRGTKAAAIGEAYVACVWFGQAQRARIHEDSSIRRLAEKTVKGIPHQEFPEICERLGRLRGPMSKAGKRIADRNRQTAERTIELGDGIEFQELRSMASLQRVGRALRNCTAQKGYAQRYLKDVRDGDAEMWALLERQQPVFLLKVDRSTREIDEFEGKEGATQELKSAVAFKALNTLDISGDEQEAFAEIGAFCSFRGGRPAVEPIEIEGCQYWIWVLRDGTEIVVATKNRADIARRWSKFSRGDCEGRSHLRGPRRRRRSWAVDTDFEFTAGPWNHLSEGSLLGLVLDHPAFAEKLRKSTPLADSQPPRCLTQVAIIPNSKVEVLPDTDQEEKTHG